MYRARSGSDISVSRSMVVWGVWYRVPDMWCCGAGCVGIGYVVCVACVACVVVCVGCWVRGFWCLCVLCR